ncbi:hypothetical protein ACF09H_16260 [Streptomyces sp. NPDC014983]|uniref:hypothetical protein n=1 Tax=Streptomyces sp. NPDC014983 TaxID=3364933 RepID=UPI0036FE765B
MVLGRPRGTRGARPYEPCAAGSRPLALTNGAADSTRAVLDRAVPTDLFEAHPDVTAISLPEPVRKLNSRAA